MFKKFRMWLWTKTKTIEQMIKISGIIDIHTKKLVNALEKLDQQSVYICKMPGASMEEIQTAKEAFEEAAKKMRWTMPKIIFMNAELEKQKKKGS